MTYIIQESLKGNIKIRNCEQDTIEEIKKLLEEQIPFNITYMNAININNKN